jgi:hypothetical protein
MEKRTTQEIALHLAGRVSMSHLLLERARGEKTSERSRKTQLNKLSSAAIRFTESVRALDRFPGAVDELNFFLTQLMRISPERVKKMNEDIAAVREHISKK